MKPIFVWRHVAAVVALLGASPLWASNLLADYQRARQYDAAFSASLTEYETQRLQASVAATAYYPQAKFSRTQLANESEERQTLTVTQPIVNWDRWLNLQEVDPRNAMAQATLERQQYDLAQRLFKTVSTLSESREKLLLNDANIKALEAQTTSAQRMFELGMGTVTDVYDAKVRLAQARSQSLVLRSTLQAAERQYEVMVGTRPKANGYRLRKEPVAFQLPPLQDVLAQALAQNPNIRSSQQAIAVGEITRKRAKAVYWPSLNASMQRSQYAGNTNTSSGLTFGIDIPIDTSSYMRLQTTELELQKLREQERDTRQRIELEVQRLYAELQTALADVAIRRDAIAAAEQSLHANEKSYEGGVRSKLDVLNAIQVLHQTQSEHVSAVLQLGERLLGLHINAAAELDVVLQQVQEQLFVPEPEASTDVAATPAAPQTPAMP